MRPVLSQLAAAIEHVQRRPSAADSPGSETVSTGCAEVDRALGGGLSRGAVHEWIADVPPLCLFVQFANQALSEAPLPALGRGVGVRVFGQRDASARDEAFNSQCRDVQGGEREFEPSPHPSPQGRERGEQVVLWIGRRCWPNPVVLGRRAGQGPALLERSLFVDPPDASSRLWAIDLALRSPAVAMVVADGSSLAMAQSRRLQLAAEARGDSQGGLCLLARPAAELKTLSVASTRWTVSPMPADGDEPRWRVELVRAKTARSVPDDLAWTFAEGAL